MTTFFIKTCRCNIFVTALRQLCDGFIGNLSFAYPQYLIYSKIRNTPNKPVEQRQFTTN